MFKSIVIFLFIYVTNAELQTNESSRGATLKPSFLCCDIPELGEAKHLAACSEPKLDGPCNEVQCIFEKSGFLVDKDNLNKVVYRNYLFRWSENNRLWTRAVWKAIEDCVDIDPRQYLDYPCKAYDVFSCTGMALFKRCAAGAWKC